MTNVVLIGAGFAGLEAAKQLAGQRGVHLTIIDRRNYHLFQPLLYQVATAGLDPSNIAVPIRAQFERAPNVDVHLAEIDAIDLDRKTIRSGQRSLAFDYLIVATGASHSYFGHPEWEPHAPGLKTLEQAVEIRRRVLTAFERAENARDERVRAAYLTFVVVGGGPTGVELAGAIADIRRTVLTRDFRHIDPTSARVLLCQGDPRILPQFDGRLAAKAADALGQLGVEVRMSTRVQHVDAEGVVANGQRIAAKTVLWAAGVMSSALGEQLGAAVDRSGRVPVSSDLSLAGHPDVFVVGDLARVELPSGPAPGLASVAIQEGRTAARNILASVRGRERKPFRYHDKGMLATIGKHRAIAQLKHVRLTGYVAWVLWLFVHLFFLVGFHNRVQVFRDWAWSYLFSKRGSRLIMSDDWRLKA
ncbi:MAG TPA: NAD(P)/FAD-dependent oxidoreductase [Kofleriaceae bacterium]|jgi:NADH dehydrogenase|nr:NAD(P)/FAD-dependent oxidoreductase [Kofleriaceae bacterium]